jgi:DNA repair exonuclease SbcCD ATPase subunit
MTAAHRDDLVRTLKEELSDLDETLAKISDQRKILESNIEQKKKQVSDLVQEIDSVNKQQSEASRMVSSMDAARAALKAMIISGGKGLLQSRARLAAWASSSSSVAAVDDSSLREFLEKGWVGLLSGPIDRERYVSWKGSSLDLARTVLSDVRATLQFIDSVMSSLTSDEQSILAASGSLVDALTALGRTQIDDVNLACQQMTDEVSALERRQSQLKEKRQRSVDEEALLTGGLGASTQTLGEQFQEVTLLMEEFLDLYGGCHQGDDTQDYAELPDRVFGLAQDYVRQYEDRQMTWRGLSTALTYLKDAYQAAQTSAEKAHKVEALAALKALLAANGVARTMVLASTAMAAFDDANGFIKSFNLEKDLQIGVSVVDVDGEGGVPQPALDITFSVDGRPANLPSNSQGLQVSLALDVAVQSQGGYGGFIIVDEPEQGLDTQTRGKINTWLRSLGRQVIVMTNTGADNFHKVLSTKDICGG